MNVIPVIDYLQGHVVLAQLGDRDHYQPIASNLCPNSDIESVLAKILSISTFNTIYIADLDCIENNRIDTSLWPKICSQYPDIEFWLDLGEITLSWNEIMQHSPNSRPVLGSESFSSISSLSKGLNSLQNLNPLLSLDIKNNKILGPSDLLSRFFDWPRDIILLPLNSVGSSKGPDLTLIEKIRSVLPKQSFYYGGGIRNIDDLLTLSKLNISGALIASSLHNGKINQNNLLSNDM